MFLPIVAIGLLLGPLVDRMSRRWLMIASDLARFGVFAALPFVESPTAIVALAAVAGIATGFFIPAANAAIPNLVPEEELVNANSLIATAETLAWMDRAGRRGRDARRVEPVGSVRGERGHVPRLGRARRPRLRG